MRLRKYYSVFHILPLISFPFMILGARDILCVEFQPTDARKYALDVSLRVDMNPRIR